MGATSKPKTLEEYKKWLRNKHRIDVTRSKNYYESVALRIKQQFESSDYWRSLKEHLKEYDAEYKMNTGYPLLMPPTERELYIKPYESLLVKTYRKNCLENKNWPDPPEGGWILPNKPLTWYPKINDIVRTLFVVKYLDGVEFLVNKLIELAEEMEIKAEKHFVAKEEGYYAAHLYLIREFEVPKENWDTEIITLKVEIQVTTQLQEVIRQLLHKYYESKRKETIKEKSKQWQWDYKSDEFIANYLGHILHYLEGMIVEIREKQREVGL